MYYHNKVKVNTNNGKKLLKNYFFYKKNPSKYINVSKYDKTNIARSICDLLLAWPIDMQ